MYALMCVCTYIGRKCSSWYMQLCHITCACMCVRMSNTLQPKKKDWRQQHEQFVASIRAAREVTRSIAKGGPLPAYTPSAPNPDYVRCPYCERRFQEDTAQRHIPFCKEKSQRLNSKASKSAGTEMLNKRTQVCKLQARTC